MDDLINSIESWADGLARRSRTIKTFYEVGDELGEGITSVVYEGTNRMTGQRVALKKMENEHMLDDPDELHCLKMEVEVLGKITHPFVIKLHELILTSTSCFLVMDLIEGGDLLTPLEKAGALSEEVSRRVFAQMITAVEYLHSKGICHRDLKPENVCFVDDSTDSDIVLIDFGAAAYTEGGRDLKDLGGTPLYAAPEVVPWYFYTQAEDPDELPVPPQYTKSVDFWSMGITLFVMLSGEGPFNQEQEIEDILQDVEQANYGFQSPMWRNVSAEAKDMIAQCLCIDVNQRLDLEGMKAHPWMQGAVEQIQAELAVEADVEQAEEFTGPVWVELLCTDSGGMDFSCGVTHLAQDLPLTDTELATEYTPLESRQLGLQERARAGLLSRGSRSQSGVTGSHKAGEVPARPSVPAKPLAPTPAGKPALGNTSAGSWTDKAKTTPNFLPQMGNASKPPSSGGGNVGGGGGGVGGGSGGWRDKMNASAASVVGVPKANVAMSNGVPKPNFGNKGSVGGVVGLVPSLQKDAKENKLPTR